MTQQWTKFMIDFSGRSVFLPWQGRVLGRLPGLCHLAWSSIVKGGMAEEMLRLWAVPQDTQPSREGWPESGYSRQGALSVVV